MCLINLQNLQGAKDYVKQVSLKSTCAALKVGSIITDVNFNLLSNGWNNTKTSVTQCNQLFEKRNNIWYNKLTNKICNTQKDHHNWSQQNEIHGE